MRGIIDWLDDRTGVRALVRSALYERIPGGARWRYVWGSTLLLVLFVQFVTGVALWAMYSANAQGAWESVFYIQTVMRGGWLLRGVHHYAAQVAIVLVAIHVVQVVAAGAYRAPREVNYWIGLGLLALLFALSLTGYLLPWDQDGYWATKVATSIASMTPVVGPSVQQVLIGGVDYGHHTLTRFLALHAGILPAGIVLLVCGHLYLFRRHGVTTSTRDRSSGRSDGWFWPDQALKDGIASLVILVVILTITISAGGTELGAPADPAEPFAAARPDWYFMFLFQWLKYFPAGWEVVGAQVIPGLVAAVLVAMPFIGRTRTGHRFNLGFGFMLLTGVGLLTWLGFASDADDPAFARAQAEAAELAERAAELASAPTGIPTGGAAALLRNDPMTQGPRLFSQSCSGCHRFNGHDGLGAIPIDDPSAPDLSGFGTEEWLTGLVDPSRIVTAEYFGSTEHRNGRMARFVTRGVAGFSEEQREKLRAVVLAVASESIPDSALAAEQRPMVELGRRAFADPDIDCARCHTFREHTDGDVGPVLTGWGSRAWMLGMLHDPTDPAYYGSGNDRMPRFGAEAQLQPREMELIVDWLRGVWYVAPTSDDGREGSD